MQYVGEILSASAPIPPESETKILEAHRCTYEYYFILQNVSEAMFSVSCRQEFQKQVRENASSAFPPCC